MLVDAEELSYAYHSGAQVLRDVSFSIPENQAVGLIGPNGSGKSTMIRVIVDLLATQRGTVFVNSSPNSSRRAKMSAMYVASNENLPEFLTGHEYLLFMFGLYRERLDPAAMERLFERYQMAGRANDLIEDYSHGMRKKLQLIGALLLQRKLTIIDETLNGIDIDALFTFERDIQLLAEDGRSVILCSHDFPMLQRVTDRVLFLNHGILAVDADTADVMDEHGSLDALVRDFIGMMQ